MTTSTNPKITVAIQPHGYDTATGAAYTYMTIPQAEAFIADMQRWIEAAKETA